MEIHISGSPVHVVTLSPSLPQPERRPQPPRRFTPAFSMPCSVPTVWPKLVHLHFAFRWPSPPFTVPPTLIHFIKSFLAITITFRDWHRPRFETLPVPSSPSLVIPRPASRHVNKFIMAPQKTTASQSIWKFSNLILLIYSFQQEKLTTLESKPITLIVHIATSSSPHHALMWLQPWNA